MVLSILTLLLVTQAPPAPNREALVRALLIHVRDAETSFDSETDPPTKWFDSNYNTVFVSCGMPPGVTTKPPLAIPCSVPSDLLQSREGKRTLKAVPTHAQTSRDVHTFTLYILYIDVHGTTADVGVHFYYSSYFCFGTYHMRLHKGAWSVEGAELGGIS